MKKLVPLIIVLLISNASFSQRAFIGDSLDAYITRAISEWHIPGISVGITRNGKLEWLKGYGVCEAGKADKVDANTLFMIGSNTKAFTATALATLAAEKKLTLDDKVTRWLPDFKMSDTWVGKELSIRDILSHRLGYETFQGDFMFFDSDLTKQEVLARLAKMQPLYSFRSRWGYCNAAFLLGGEVLAAASGMSWDQYMRERIFRPLGMDRSLALSKEITTATNKASAHTWHENKLKVIPYGKIDNMAPAGSISSSASDLMKWVSMLLDDGKWNGGEFIPRQALMETRAPHSILGDGPPRYNTGHFLLYGLGWFLQEYNGKQLVHHTGGVNGFVTSVTLLPEEKLGIVILTNTDHNQLFEVLKWELMDAYLGLPYRDYSSEALREQDKYETETAAAIKLKRDTVNMHKPAALPLSAYAGKYRHDLYGDMQITVDGQALKMQFEHHKGHFARLEPLGGNRFLSTWDQPIFGVRVLPFTVENGKVRSLRVRVADFIEFTPYEFQKTE